MTAKPDIWKAGDLYDSICDNLDIVDRVAEYCGPNWWADPDREIEVTLPEHCHRIDSESSFWFVEP